MSFITQNKNNSDTKKEEDNKSLASDLSEIDNTMYFRELHSVLGNFLYYQDSEGGTLNLCETILLLKESIDQNLKEFKNLNENLKELLKRHQN